MGQIGDVETKPETNHADPNPLQVNTKPFYKTEKQRSDKEAPNEQMNKERRVTIQNFESRNLQELDERVKSMMEKTTKQKQNGTKMAYVYICSLCGKEGQGIAIRDHIESNHLDGVSLPCNVCEKTFRSRMILRKHKCT